MIAGPTPFRPRFPGRATGDAANSAPHQMSNRVPVGSTRVPVGSPPPLWLEIKPAQLGWSVGAEPTPKEAVITLHPGVRLSADSLQVDGGTLEAWWRPEEGGRRYRLVLKPGSIKVPMQATVYFGAEIEGLPQRRFMIFAQVR